MECTNCGRYIRQPKGVSQLCAPCRNRNPRLQTVPDYQIVECVQCGNEFKQYRKDNIYCSNNCYSNHYQSENQEDLKTRYKTIFERVCRWCGKEFTTTNSTKIYCDRRCPSNKQNYLLYK